MSTFSGVTIGWLSDGHWTIWKRVKSSPLPWVQQEPPLKEDSHQGLWQRGCRAKERYAACSPAMGLGHLQWRADLICIPKFPWPHPAELSSLVGPGDTAQSWDLLHDPVRASHQGLWWHSCGASRRCPVCSLPTGQHHPQWKTALICFYFLKYFICLFIEKGEVRERERERNIEVRNIDQFPLTRPQMGTKPTTQAHPPAGNLTSDWHLVGWCPANWSTWVRAWSVFISPAGLSSVVGRQLCSELECLKFISLRSSSLGLKQAWLQSKGEECSFPTFHGPASATSNRWLSWSVCPSLSSSILQSLLLRWGQTAAPNLMFSCCGS